MCFTGLSIIGISILFNKEIHIDSEFEQFFNEFKEDAILYNTPLRLKRLTTTMVSTLGKGVLGVCYHSTNTVFISKQYWDVMTETERRITLYHEWGHCVLEREHVSDVQISLLINYLVCPVTIMYPSIMHERCYLDSVNYYKKELFVNPYKYSKISEENI